MIVNIGIKSLIALLSNEVWEIALGTGKTSEWADNLTLENEYTRDDATLSIISTNITDDTLRFEATFPFAEEKEISELGIFHKSGGWMLIRKVFVSVPIPASYELPVRYNLIAKRV